MSFNTRPHFQDRDFVQYIDESITLSGNTIFDSDGQIKINPTYLQETTGSTINISGQVGELVSNRISGLVIEPPILNLLDPSGNTTGQTFVDVTGYVLTSYDSGGTSVWTSVASLSADTNTYTTGGTLINDLLVYDNNLTLSAYTIDVSNLRFSGGSGNCITDLYTSNIHGCSPITIHNNLQNVSSTATGVNSIALSTNSNVSGNYSTTIGGKFNIINNYTYSGIFVGSGNTIQQGNYSVIIGGRNNLTTQGFSAIISSENSIMAGYNSTILGGYNNQVSALRSIIGGGSNNIIVGEDVAIIGGQYNIIGSNTNNGFIGGGISNTISTFSNNSSIIGGGNNSINGINCFIGGGLYNNIDLSASKSSIIGGEYNFVNGATNSHIIGSNITATTDNTTFVNNFDVNEILTFSNVTGGTFINNINTNLDISVDLDPINGNLFKIYFGSSYFGIRQTGTSNTTESVFFGNDTLGDVLQLTTDGVIVEQEITSLIYDNGDLSGTFDLNITYGNVQMVTLTGNTTINGITGNTNYGGDLTLYVYQDGVGGHSLTKGSNILTEGGNPIVVTSTSNSTDTLVFKTDNNGNYRLHTHIKDFS
jgi:hypothetical protein